METTTKMPVFLNKRTGGYSGGMCIVAARSKEEAHGVLYKELEYESGEYDANCWKQIQNVYCETDTPVFIDEDGYTE